MAANLISEDIFSRLQLFRGVDMSTVAPILASCEVIEIADDELLLTPHVENNAFYIIVAGRLMVHLENPLDPPTTSLDAGECVGELSIFDKGNPSAYVIASETTRLLALPENALWDLITASHNVAVNLLYIMSKRVRDSNVTLVDSEHEANIDPLTGLHNRRWFEDVYGREVRRSDLTGELVCLAMVDIDRFKAYNDSHGHPAGDATLCVVADALRKNLRPADMVARFGGEEFIVMLPETGIAAAVDIAERLRTAVAERRVHDKALGDLPSVTISIGVAERPPGESLEELISLADDALYRAKRGGRDRVCPIPAQ